MRLCQQVLGACNRFRAVAQLKPGVAKRANVALGVSTRSLVNEQHKVSIPPRKVPLYGTTLQAALHASRPQRFAGLLGLVRAG